MSGVGIASRSPQRRSLIQSLVRRRNEKSYCARLYYHSSGMHSWEVYFTITWDLEFHLAVSIQVIVWNLESHIAVSIKRVQIMP